MLVSHYISGLLFWGKLLHLSSAEMQNDGISKNKVNVSSNLNNTLLPLPTEEMNSQLHSSVPPNKTKVYSTPALFLKSNITAHIPAIRAYLRHEDIKKSSSRSQAVSAGGDISPSLHSVQMAAAVA